MRNLNKKQKEALTIIFKQTLEPGVENLDGDILSKIEKLNPHELFYQNANRFLYDLSRGVENGN